MVIARFLGAFLVVATAGVDQYQVSWRADDESVKRQDEQPGRWVLQPRLQPVTVTFHGDRVGIGKQGQSVEQRRLELDRACDFDLADVPALHMWLPCRFCILHGRQNS
jgi:hypothetical protein